MGNYKEIQDGDCFQGKREKKNGSGSGIQGTSKLLVMFKINGNGKYRWHLLSFVYTLCIFYKYLLSFN